MPGPLDQERAVARPASGRPSTPPRSAIRKSRATEALVPLRRPLGIQGNGHGEPDGLPYFLVEAGATVRQVARYIADDPNLPGILATLNGLSIDQPLPGGAQVRLPVHINLLRPVPFRQLLEEINEGLYIAGPASHHGKRTNVQINELGGIVIPLTESELIAMCRTRMDATGRSNDMCRRLLDQQRQRVRESERATGSHLKRIERSSERQQLLDRLSDSLRADDQVMAQWASELVDRRISTSFEDLLDNSQFVSDRQRRIFMRYYLQDSATAQGRILDADEVFWMLVEMEDAYVHRSQRRHREADESAAQRPDRRDAELATIKKALHQYHMEASQRTSRQRFTEELTRVLAAPDDPEMRSLAHKFVNREFRGTVINFLLHRRWTSDIQRRKFLQYFVVDYAETWEHIRLDPDELFLTLYDLETQYQRGLAELDQEVTTARLTRELAEILRIPGIVRKSFATDDPVLRKRARDEVLGGADEHILWTTLTIRRFSSDETRRIYTRYFLMYLEAAGSRRPIQAEIMDNAFDTLQRRQGPDGHIFRRLVEYERRFEENAQVAGAPSKIPDEQVERILKRARTEAAKERMRGSFPGVVRLANYPLLAYNTAAIEKLATAMSDPEVIEFMVAFVPGVGEDIAILEFIIGREIFTGRELRGFDRWLLLLPVIPLAGQILRNGARGTRIVAEVAKATGKTDAEVAGLLHRLHSLSKEERALEQAAAVALYGGRITATEQRALTMASVALKEGETAAAQATGEGARLGTEAGGAASKASREEALVGRGTTANGVTPDSSPAKKGRKKLREPTAMAKADRAEPEVKAAQQPESQKTPHRGAGGKSSGFEDARVTSRSTLPRKPDIDPLLRGTPLAETAETGGISSIRSKSFRDGSVSFTIEGEILPPLWRETGSAPPGRGKARNFNKLFRRPGIALPHYEAAHLWGPGWGDEARAGIMFAPPSVNRELQRLGKTRGIEGWIQEFAEAANARGGKVRVKATAVSYPKPKFRQLVLEHAEYVVTIEMPGDLPRSYRLSIEVGPPPIGTAKISVPELVPP